MDKKLLIKISGKILNPENPQLIKAYADALSNLYSQGYRIVVVVGGGRYARNYISCAKLIGLNDAQADILGIEITRVNALLLALTISDLSYTPIPRSIDEVQRAWSSNKIVIIGGLQPGQSTASVASIIAETLNIKTVLYATDVDGIYDKDPRKCPNAKKLDKVTVEQVKTIISQRYEAGGYELLDLVALQIIKRSCIDVIVFNGMDPQNIYKALEGNIGTKIQPC